MNRPWRRYAGRLAVSAVLLAGGGAVAGHPGGAEEPTYRSPIHICLSLDGLKAYVVNHTSDSVSILDVRERKVIGEFPVGSRPSHATLSPNGRTLYVTSRDGAAVEVVDLEQSRSIRSIQTEYEPYGACLSPDGAELHVVNSLSETVSIIDTRSGRTTFTVPVGPSPRYVSRTPDGSRLVVSDGLARGVSIIDPARGLLLETRTLGRASILRDVVCSPDGRWAFVAHLVSHDETPTMQMERGWVHSNGFSILDLQKPGHYVTLLLDRLLQGAANPWGLTLSSDGRTLYVTLSGAHEVAIVDVPGAMAVVAETAPDEVTRLSQDVAIVEERGIARRVASGGLGPRGIVLSEATGEILTANYFSEDVSVLDAETGAVLGVIPLGPPQEMTVWRRGELLFNDARLCYQGWFSCASCHQEDGTVDALNWDLPNDGLGNPKNAKSLHDVGDSPPAMWGGVRKDIDAAVQAGQRFLGAIPEPENHDALMAFISNPRRAPNAYRTRNPDALGRGRKVFTRARCDVCHPAPTYTDLKMHDLGLAGKTDLRSRFDTPSLRECYRTAPYLHDGRARTLREIFTDHNPTDFHGRTSGLTAAQLEDLLEFLRSL